MPNKQDERGNKHQPSRRDKHGDEHQLDIGNNSTNPMVAITVRVSRDIKEKLELEAALNGISINGYLSIVISTFRAKISLVSRESDQELP